MCSFEVGCCRLVAMHRLGACTLPFQRHTFTLLLGRVRCLALRCRHGAEASCR